MMIEEGSNNYPVSLRQVRQANPNVSLPKQPDEATLNSLGYATVQPTERPTGDVVTEGAPEQQADGTWRQTWDVRSYTDAERAEALDRARNNKRREINDAYEAELNVILANYPDVETKTWDKQDTEARAWQADNTVATPLIDRIAASRGLDKAELVTRIIAKSDAWIDLSGSATGKRQALEADISDATTIADVDAIVW